MVDLSKRQRLILALVIHEYIETAQPVGSIHLVERYGLTWHEEQTAKAVPSTSDALPPR